MKSEVYMSPEMKLLFLKVERIICASLTGEQAEWWTEESEESIF